VNARAAVAPRRADDEIIEAAEILIIRGKEQGRLLESIPWTRELDVGGGARSG
jgi:hypothetical protein